MLSCRQHYKKILKKKKEPYLSSSATSNASDCGRIRRFQVWLLAGSQCTFWASLGAQAVKNLPAMQETWVWCLGREDPLEKGMATHSSVLAWAIPWTEKRGRVQSMGSQKELDMTEWVTQPTWSKKKKQNISKKTWYIHISAHLHQERFLPESSSATWWHGFT